ncbi:hypothetical protein CJ468_06494 [Nocardia farcinica]|nr:hypothetical protein CJ468_06494 [Nocardia farcinica]
MSRISPGIFEESNTSVLPGWALISASIGFQVAAACTLGVEKAAMMSASEVFTTLTSRSLMPALSRARARK